MALQKIVRLTDVYNSRLHGGSRAGGETNAAKDGNQSQTPEAILSDLLAICRNIELRAQAAASQEAR